MIRKAYHKIWEITAKSSGKKLSKIDIDEVCSVYNLQYGADKKNNLFDVHFPRNKTKKLPTIFVIHGGGHISGKKAGTDKYSKLLANRGFCTVNMEYTKCDGPEKKYFLNQLAEFYDLYDYLSLHKEEFKMIDFDNIFLAGDSAGAHIASMIANIQTNNALDGKVASNGGLKVKGLILVSPIFAHVIATKKMVFGDNENKDTIWQCNAFNTLSKKFPPVIMFSAKTDFLVANFKNKFFKKVEQLNLSVKHFEVCKAHKLFHDSLVDYAEYYPNCLKEIANFVNDVSNDKCKNEFVKKEIYENKNVQKVYEK